jgi:hypothetical protein
VRTEPGGPQGLQVQGGEEREGSQRDCHREDPAQTPQCAPGGEGGRAERSGSFSLREANLASGRVEVAVTDRSLYRAAAVTEFSQEGGRIFDEIMHRFR